MRYRFAGLLALLIGLGIVIAVPTGAAEPSSADKIDKLIEKLGSDDFSDREKAATELDAIGVPALPALRKAAKNTDAEIRKQSAELLSRIEKRNETALLLAPKKIHLVYKDTPVTEAVADFARKSGYPITLNDPEGKLKDRKISLDTGEVTFWRALDLFCTQADLHEMEQGVNYLTPRPIRRVPGNVIRPAVVVPAVKPAVAPPAAVPPQPLPANPAPPKEEESSTIPQTAVLFREAPVAPPAAPPALPVPAPAPVRAQARVAVAIAPIAMGGFTTWNAAGPNPQIILIDGKTKPLPTDDTSAVRVQVMDKTEQFGPANAGEILLGLKLTAEPKLLIQTINSVRIEKAKDNVGQTLELAMAAAKPDPNAPVAMPAQAMIRIPMNFGGMSQFTPLRLKKGEKEATSLKELAGVINAQILTPPVPYITVPKIMEAAGKEEKGAEGGRLKVLEVTKDANGQIIVRFECDQPPNIVPGNLNPVAPPMALPLPKGALPANPGPVAPKAGFKAEPIPGPKGGPAVPAPAPPGAPAAPVPQVIQLRVAPVMVPGGVVFHSGGSNGISLEDEKGKLIPVVSNRMVFRGGGAGVMVREQVMTFQPEKDQVPSKLVFFGRRSVAIDIPFAIKDVKLP